MCKRGVITHYRRGHAPVRHAVRLGKDGGIKIDGATWGEVLQHPREWTFGHVDRGGLLGYVRELAAAKGKARPYV